MIYDVIDDETRVTCTVDLSEMESQLALRDCFGEVVDEGTGVKRKMFSNQKSADVYSNCLGNLWCDGLGMVYGPFVSATTNGGNKWWEVSFK